MLASQSLKLPFKIAVVRDAGATLFCALLISEPFCVGPFCLYSATKVRFFTHRVPRITDIRALSGFLHFPFLRMILFQMNSIARIDTTK